MDISGSGNHTYQVSCIMHVTYASISIFSHTHTRSIIYLTHELLWLLVIEEFNKKNANLESNVNFANL
jgi:hypothetical protein